MLYFHPIGGCREAIWAAPTHCLRALGLQSVPGFEIHRMYRYYQGCLSPPSALCISRRSLPFPCCVYFSSPSQTIHCAHLSLTVNQAVSTGQGGGDGMTLRTIYTEWSVTKKSFGANKSAAVISKSSFQGTICLSCFCLLWCFPITWIFTDFIYY